MCASDARMIFERPLKQIQGHIFDLCEDYEQSYHSKAVYGSFILQAKPREKKLLGFEIVCLDKWLSCVPVELIFSRDNETSMQSSRSRGLESESQRRLWGDFSYRSHACSYGSDRRISKLARRFACTQRQSLCKSQRIVQNLGSRQIFQRVHSLMSRAQRNTGVICHVK